MKKLIIISTDSTSGRGGISTSVRNCLELLEKHNIPFEHIKTHSPHQGKTLNSLLFLKAFIKVTTSQVNESIFYLHVGPKGSLIRKIILLAAIKIKKGKAYTHYHSPTFLNYVQKDGFWKRSLSLLSKLSDKNLCLNNYWKTEFEKELKNPFICLPNPINTPKPVDDTTPNRENPEIHITCAARLVEEKNVQELIRLAELNKKITLKIIGGGPYEKELRTLANKSTAVDRITFTGWLDNALTRCEIRNSDLFILPSKYDSFGMVYIESLAEGTPVIAPKLPPVIETLLNLKGVSHADTAEEINELIGKMPFLSRCDIQKSLIEKFGEKKYLERLNNIIKSNN